MLFVVCSVFMWHVICCFFVPCCVLVAVLMYVVLLCVFLLSVVTLSLVCSLFVVFKIVFQNLDFAFCASKNCDISTTNPFVQANLS